MNSKLISSIRTTEERNILVEEINSLLASLYESKEGKYQDVLNSSVRGWVGRIISEDTEKEIDKEGYFKNLLAIIDKFKQVNLKIAFEPSDLSVQNIYDWVQKNIANGLIIDFEIDKNIIGGAIVTYKGKYIDMTLSKKFDEYKW